MRWQGKPHTAGSRHARKTKLVEHRDQSVVGTDLEQPAQQLAQIDLGQRHVEDIGANVVELIQRPFRRIRRGLASSHQEQDAVGQSDDHRASSTASTGGVSIRIRL